MKQKWKPMQFVEISMHEIFAFQDRLDAVKDDPEKVWEIVDDFFADCENQLEINPGLLRELQNMDLDSYVEVKDIDDLFNDCNIIIKNKNDTESIQEAFCDMLCELKDQAQKNKVVKEYKCYIKDVTDIPFMPRHDF